MTAVDHAELKRVAEAARAARLAYADAAVGNVVALCRAADDALEALDVACQPYEDTLIALLSEIEGLKAERDEGAEAGTEPTPEQIEPFARQWCISNGIDPDEPTPPHGEWPRWYDEAGPFAAMWKTISALRTQAPDSWRPIETAPRSGLIDIWVSGPGSRRIADCRWGKPSHANWGDRYGCDKDLPPQWITSSGCALDRRNGEATHWMPLPAAPALRPQTAESGT